MGLQVSPLKGLGNRFHVNGVLVVDRLNVPERKVELKELQEKWPHLLDLELTEVAGTQVSLLLGLLCHWKPWLNGPAFLHLPEEKWPKGNSKLEASNQPMIDLQTQEIAINWTGLRR